MNAKSLIIAAAALAAAGAASAQEQLPSAKYYMPQDFAATVTRAEVRDAAIVARAAGQIVSGEQSVVATAPVVSHLERAQVRAEAVAARRMGKTVGGEA